MPNFTGIVGAFTHNNKEWSRWYRQSTPESDSLPGEWETKCSSLRKMIMIKTIRPDRVLLSASLFVQDKLGDKFITPPSFKLDELINASKPYIPVLFILSPGTDPFNLLDNYAKQ